MDKKSSSRFVNQMLMLGLEDPKYHRILLAAYKKVAKSSPSGLPLHHLNSLWRMGSSAGGMKILLQMLEANWAKKGKKPIPDNTVVQCHGGWLSDIQKFFPKAIPFRITDFIETTSLPNGSSSERKAKPNIDMYNSEAELVKGLKKVGCPSSHLHLSIVKNGIEIQYGKDMSAEMGLFKEMLSEAEKVLKEHKEAEKRVEAIFEDIQELKEDLEEPRKAYRELNGKKVLLGREIETAKRIISNAIKDKEKKLEDGTLTEQETESLTKLQTEAEEVLTKANKKLGDIEVKQIELQSKIDELTRKIEDKKELKASISAYDPKIEELKWGVGMTDKDVKELAKYFKYRKEPKQLPVLYRNASMRYESLLKNGIPVTKITKILISCKVKESYKSSSGFTVVQEGIRSQLPHANLRELTDIVDFNAY